MRMLMTSVCVASCVAVGGALAACGGDDAAPFDVEQAATATAGKKTARVALSISVQGAGLPLPLDLEGKGTTSLTEPEGKVVLDLAPLLGLVGVPSGTPGDLELRFKGGQLFAKPPRIEQLPVTIPGGKQWASLDLTKLGAALGLPTSGLGKLFTLEPAAQLRALKATKGLKEVGKEDVGGTETTHYRGTYKLSDLIATLPAAERKEAEDALAQLDRLASSAGGQSAGLDEPVPADLWVDEDGVTRRLTSTAKLPAQGGQPGGTIKQRYELSDFGVALDAAPPAAGATYDATKAASDLLGSLATPGAGATTG